MAEQLDTGELTIAPKLYWANLSDNPRRAAWATLGDLEDRIGQIETSGRGTIFEGQYDITLTRTLARQALREEFAHFPGLTDRIHQPWARGIADGFFRPWSLKHGLFNLAARLVMPEQVKSLDIVRLIDEQLGGITLCAYPEVRDANGDLIDFSQYAHWSGAQITPESIAAAEAQDEYRKFHNMLQRAGMLGAIPDFHHAVRGGLSEDGMIAAMRRTGTFILGIHASAARYDDKDQQNREASMRDIAAILQGPDVFGRTQSGVILGETYLLACEQRLLGYSPKERLEETEDSMEASLNDEGLAWDAYLQNSNRQFTVPLSVEIPWGGLKEHRSRQGQKMSDADFLSMTRDAATSLKEFVVGYAQKALGRHRVVP